MTPLLDVHTHTIASGHAFSTLQEMAKAASEKGLEILGITEHAPSIPGTCNPILFTTYPIVPRDMYGVRLLLGCELNILNTKGEFDLGEKHLKFMDIVSAGIHSICWEGGTKEQNTDAVASVMNNPRVHIIVHPGDGTAEMNFERLVLEAKKTGKLLEVNNHSLKPWRHKSKALGNNLEILKLCKKYDQPVILGSDAHISFDIAGYQYILPLLEETDFPQELILNDKPGLFLEYLKINDTI